MGLCRRRGSFRVHHPVGVPHMGEGSWAALPSRLGSPGSCGKAFGFLTAACARNHRAKLQVRCGEPGRARCQRGLKQPPSPWLLGNREHPQPHVPQGGQGSIQKHSLSPCTHFLLQAPGDARRGGGGREQGAELCFPSRIVFQTPLPSPGSRVCSCVGRMFPRQEAILETVVGTCCSMHHGRDSWGGSGIRTNGVRQSKKQGSSPRDTETYPQALAFSLVRLEPGEIRAPWAGSEQTCLTGKGVTSGESRGVAPRLCQAGSHWHNWKGDSCAWLPDGKQAPCCRGSAAAGVRRRSGAGGCGSRCQPGDDGYPQRCGDSGVGPCHRSAPGSSLRWLWAAVQLREALLRVVSPALSCCQQTCEI